MTKKIILVLSLSLGCFCFYGAVEAQNGQAQTKDLCGPADFKTFIERYVNLPQAEQLQCVKFPVTVMDNGQDKQIADAQGLKEYFGSERIVLGAKDILPPSKASKPFIVYPKKNIDNGTTLLQKGKLGYVVFSSDRAGTYGLCQGCMRIDFVEGHTFSIYWYRDFKYENGAWRLTYLTYGDPTDY